MAKIHTCMKNIRRKEKKRNQIVASAEGPKRDVVPLKKSKNW